MKNLLIVANDHSLRSQLISWLYDRGWNVVETPDSARALESVRQHPPQVILCDLPVADSRGLKLCRDLHNHNYSTSHPPLIIAIGRGPATDRFKALEAGADEYLASPLDLPALDKMLGHLSGRQPSETAIATAPAPMRTHMAPGARLKFWGVRGSIASPGPDTVFYGGNTSCVEVRVGQNIIILDAGTGLRRLGLALNEEFKEEPMNINLLITHTHWDHIQGFPFFLPAYDPKNNVAIFGFEDARQGLEGTLSSQMESPYFPISLREMPGHITIHKVQELKFKINEVPVQAQFLSHPGVCTGYRLFTPGGSISYLPDVELFKRLRKRWNTDTALISREERHATPAEDQALVEFIRDSEALILDSQYDAVEYEKHVGWGHSCLEDSVAFALHANVKRLFLFHHDPDHTDEQISRMVARARQMAARRGSSLMVAAAREGYELVLDPPSA